MVKYIFIIFSVIQSADLIWLIWDGEKVRKVIIMKSNFSFNKYVSDTKWRLFCVMDLSIFLWKQIKLSVFWRLGGKRRVSFASSFSWWVRQTRKSKRRKKVEKNLFLADGLTNDHMTSYFSIIFITLFLFLFFCVRYQFG